MIWPHPGGHQHCVNILSCVTQDYKTAMRARGGTGEAIDLRTLVLVLRYLNQSHGEFVKNTKGSQSITYTDRKVSPATDSTNGPQTALGPLLHHLGVHARLRARMLARNLVMVCGMALQQCALASCSCMAHTDRTPHHKQSIPVTLRLINAKLLAL